MVVKSNPDTRYYMDIFNIVEVVLTFVFKRSK